MSTRKASPLLRIDAGARNDGSFSRRISDAEESTWKQARAKGDSIHRDFARAAPPQTKPTALSDTLIAALKTAATAQARRLYSAAPVLPAV